MIKRATSSLQLLLAAGSGVGLILLLLLTNPADKISYAMIFFLLLLVLLASLSQLIWLKLRGEIRPLRRYQLLIVSFSVVVLVMFKSAQSLSWLDALVLAVVTVGLLFYSGRRA